MVKALSPNTSQKTFTDGISSRRVIRCFQYLDAARCCHSSEIGPKLAVVIANEILRRVSIRSRLSQLLCGPSVSRRPCHTEVDHFARFEFDDEERKKRAKEQVGHLQEIADPHVFCMIAQERRQFCPLGLVLRTCLMYFWIVRLHTRIPSLSNSPRIRSAPQSRFSAAISLINATVSSGIFGLEDAARDLYFQNRRASMTIPPKERLLLDNEQRLLPCTRRSSEKD